MKQNITESQWGELSEKEQLLFSSKVNVKKSILEDGVTEWTYTELAIPNIGQMIEFLGENLQNIHRGKWEYIENKGMEYIESWDLELIDLKEIEDLPELCDALFQAVKFKLKSES